MRELTLLGTGYLTGMLVLSLVLPLMMSFGAPRVAAARRSGMRIVWLGQALIAVAGLGVLASAGVAPYAAGFGAVSCVGCAWVLRRQSTVNGLRPGNTRAGA